MTFAPTTTASLIGRVFHGRFRIEKLIGRGGMGAVYQAQQLGLDKPVALKVLAKHLAEEERQVERFKQEALRSSKLRHPNTIRVLDYGQSDDGYLYLAMELLEGTELSKVLRDGPLEPRRAVKIARQICKAIGEAHAHGLVHRDLKPDNIFLCDFFGEKDFVKVLDFGIAKFMEDTPGQEALTQTGFICGTPLYIAPEQALGKPVTARTDLYACGVLLYEMLVGAPPFRADTPIAIVMRHIHDQPPDLRHFKPDLNIPIELERLVFQLLAKDARERPSSAEEVGMALEDVLSSGLLGKPRTAPKMPILEEPEATKVLTADQLAMLDSDPEMPAPVGYSPEINHDATMMLDTSSPAGAIPVAQSGLYGGAIPTGMDLSPSSTSQAGGGKRLIWLAALLIVIGGGAAAVVAMTGGDTPAAKPFVAARKASPPKTVEPKRKQTTVAVDDPATQPKVAAVVKPPVPVPDVMKNPPEEVELGAGKVAPVTGADAGSPDSGAGAAAPSPDVVSAPDAATAEDAGPAPPPDAAASAVVKALPFMVKIDCDPTGCTVYDGRKKLGTAPIQVELETNRSLKVKLRGYSSETIKLDVATIKASGQPWVTVELKKRAKGGGGGNKWKNW